MHGSPWEGKMKQTLQKDWGQGRREQRGSGGYREGIWGEDTGIWGHWGDDMKPSAVETPRSLQR